MFNDVWEVRLVRMWRTDSLRTDREQISGSLQPMQTRLEDSEKLNSVLKVLRASLRKATPKGLSHTAVLTSRRGMVNQDYSGITSAQCPRAAAGWGSGVLKKVCAATLLIGCVCLATALVSSRYPEGLGGPVALDVDDDTFFHTGDRIGKVGDRELQLADAALRKGDLTRAEKYAEHAAKAYKRADANGRLEEAEEVVGSVTSALKSAARVKRVKLEAIVARARHVEEEKAAMAAQATKEALAAAKDSVVARKPIREVSSRISATTVAKFATKATTHMLDESATPTPDPKVLDCGPLGANCHEGEFYSKKGALSADAAVKVAEQRLAMKKGASACDACMNQWSTSSLDCVTNKCSVAPHILSHVQSLQAAKSTDNAALNTAMEGFDWQQLKLNNARAEIFARFVGSDTNSNTLLLLSNYATEWVTPKSSPVKMWLDVSPAFSDKGMAALGIKKGMKQSVEVTREGGVTETISSAEACTEPGVSGGLTLEEAMAPLNEEQERLNEERQKVYGRLTHSTWKIAKQNRQASKFFGSGDPDLDHTPVVTVLMRWKKSGVTSAKAAKTQELAEAPATPVAVKVPTQPVQPAQPSQPAVAAREPVVAAVAVKPASTVPATAVKPVASVAVVQPTAPRVQHVQHAAAEQQRQVRMANAVVVQAAAAKAASAIAAKIADDTEGGNFPKMGSVDNELPEEKAKDAAKDMSAFFNELIEHRVAVGRARVVGGGLAAEHQQSKEEMRHSEDAAIGGGSAAKPVGQVKAYKAEVVGNELVHGKDSAASSQDMESYFDSLIKKKVAVGDGVAKPAKAPVVGSELHKGAVAAKVVATATGGAQLPVVGSELVGKGMSGLKASGDIDSYFNELVHKKVAVGRSARDTEQKSSASKADKSPFVGNELKDLGGLQAHQDLSSYFNKVIKKNRQRK